MMLALRYTIAATTLIVSAMGVFAEDDRRQAVDGSFDAVRTAVSASGLTEIIQIDHARLAAAEGVDMPPSRVQLFSDPRINTTLLSENIRAGLDLPFRILSYDDGERAALTHTPSTFLARRHGLADADALSDFDTRLAGVFSRIEGPDPVPVATEGVTGDFAIIELRSRYDVPETVARLTRAVTAQPDTVWFGEIDFQAEAALDGVTLAPARLLLFGGPAPGGVSMAEFPTIGLDAFCQKLLVYEGEDGETVVLFNDIAALARLHYGRTIEPHALLNQRLTATFTGAIN